MGLPKVPNVSSWKFELLRSGPLLHVGGIMPSQSGVCFLDFGNLFCLSRSGPLLVRCSCHGLVRFRCVSAVTVWSAVGAV